MITNMIKIYVKITFYDENGLHPAGSITMVKEDDFNPFYMKKIPDLPPIPANLGDLADVATTGAQNGDVLTYDGIDWIPGIVSSVESLDELDDVAISSASNGQVLTYTDGSWVNATPATPSGGGIDASVIADEYEEGTPGPTYNVGDYVKKSTKYYICTGTTSGAWDSSKWTEITISFNKTQGQVPASGYAISNDDKLWKNKSSSVQAWFDPANPGSWSFTECHYTTYEAGSLVTYTAGDYAMYEDELYICTGTTSGAWDSTKWTKISVEEMVVENAGAQTLDELSDVDVDTATDGQVLTYDAANTKWIPTTTSGTLVIECNVLGGNQLCYDAVNLQEQLIIDSPVTFDEIIDTLDAGGNVVLKFGQGQFMKNAKVLSTCRDSDGDFALISMPCDENQTGSFIDSHWIMDSDFAITRVS